jgi:PAN domain
MLPGATDDQTSGRAARMRLHLILIGALICVVLAGPARAQSGYDRVGGDYLTFTVHSGDPAVCASRCERDSRCRAWSFSYPRTKHSLASCALKNKVLRRTEDKCCVSGVRGAGVIEPRRGSLEYSIDRIGGDYRSFDTTTDTDGGPCKDACESENRCRAWTYVRPGYMADSARCYLKSRITRPRRRPCCISGVVR